MHFIGSSSTLSRFPLLLLNASAQSRLYSWTAVTAVCHPHNDCLWTVAGLPAFTSSCPMLYSKLHALLC